MGRHAVSSDRAPAALGPYSQAIVAGGLIFCSGMAGIDPSTGTIPDGIEAQTEQALLNLAAVLDLLVAALGDVVKTTIFYADVETSPGSTRSTPGTCPTRRPPAPPRLTCAYPTAFSSRSRRSPSSRTGRCNGSLRPVFDHVGVAVSDLAASEHFYRTVLSVLGVEPSHADAGLVEWDDWAIGPPDREHPVTRGLHVGFRSPSRRRGRFCRRVIDAGYRDDGAPGPRTVYGPDYYGAFLLDPDGNSAEAVHSEREQPVPDGRIDHLWIRVRDPAASKRFYTTIAPHAGLRIGVDEPDHVQLVGEDFSLAITTTTARAPDLTFPAEIPPSGVYAVALVAARRPRRTGERAIYHPGYYGAFVLDPDGHNVEVVNHNL